jgi:hypothetical protein
MLGVTYFYLNYGLGWICSSSLQSRRTVHRAACPGVRDQDQAWPIEDAKDHPRVLQVAVTLFREALDGFLRPDNFNEVVYAFSTGTDQVSLSV